jgi:hypothetical protein
MAPRAFISFQMEDKWARDLLVQNAHCQKTEIDFVDYPVQDHFDTAWKFNCKQRIARTSGTIVLIGSRTYTSSAVIWEIEETLRQGHHVFGVQIKGGEYHRLPVGLPSSNVVQFDFKQIIAQLETWV